MKVVTKIFGLKSDGENDEDAVSEEPLLTPLPGQAGLGLACLYLTVLGFDNITYGFCLMQVRGCGCTSVPHLHLPLCPTCTSTCTPPVPHLHLHLHLLLT